MDPIGAKLYNFRKKRGMSRKKVAEGICDESTLYRIEKDLQEPQLYTLRLLCKKLGISLSQLLSPLDRDKLIYISKMKHLCRKFVYYHNYNELEMLISGIEENTILSNEFDLDFHRFIHWHKAILLHEIMNDINEAKQKLINLLPETDLIVNETDFGIANSLGYIYLELNEKNKAFEIYNTIFKKYDTLPEIEDKLLYVRVVYNYIFTLFCMENYNEVILIGSNLIDFLESNYLKIMLSKIHHLLGIAYEKKEQLFEAESHMKKATELFLIEGQQFNYLKSLRALAEIQFKSGRIDVGTLSIQILKKKLVEFDDPKNLPHLVMEMERKYLIKSPSTST